MRRNLVSPVLVGRDAELSTLTAALDEAAAGVPGVVLLGGEAGVGKTRLVEEAAERAAAAGARGGVLALAACFGAGSIVTEVVADTNLQRSLDPDVFGRAYGIAFSASIGGIAAGALLAPVAVSLVGVEGTLIGLGALTLAYGAAMLLPSARRRRTAVLALGRVG